MIAVVILLLMLALLRRRRRRPFFFRWSRARGTAVLPSLYASPYFRSVLLKNTRRFWHLTLIPHHRRRPIKIRMPFQTRAMVGGCLSFLSFPSARAFLSLLLTREGGRVVEIPSRPFWWLAVEVDDVFLVDRTTAMMNKGRRSG